MGSNTIYKVEECFVSKDFEERKMKLEELLIKVINAEQSQIEKGTNSSD